MVPNNAKSAQVNAKTTPSLAGRRAAIARAKKGKDPDAEREARREYAAEKLADFITRTVDSAPPLTSEQRERLATLLRGGQVA
jgi:hypothetical protein